MPLKNGIFVGHRELFDGYVIAETYAYIDKYDDGKDCDRPFARKIV